MKSANFSITPRASALNNKDGGKNEILESENVHVLHTEVHIRKTSGIICGSVNMSVLLMVFTGFSIVFTAALGQNSSSWFFIVTAFDILGLVGYVSGNSTVVAFYHELMEGYLALMLVILVRIIITGVHSTSLFFNNYNFHALARYCYHKDVIFFLIFFSICMAVRIYVTHLYMEFITFTKILSKLKTQRFVLEARI